MFMTSTIVLSVAFAGEVDPLPLRTIQIGNRSIEVELADEIHERQRGLMHRKEIESNHGMLFVYPVAELRSFWMKNTYIPLSIAYIGSDCQIVHIASMTPLSTKGVPSVYPAQFALEMNQGWFEGNGVKVGDTLKVVHPSNYVDAQGHFRQRWQVSRFTVTVEQVQPDSAVASLDNTDVLTNVQINDWVIPAVSKNTSSR